jgi:hypothetical protein
MNWRKSSYSGQGGGNCIEVADDDSLVMVRDTADRQGPMLRFTPDAWRRLVKQLKSLGQQYPIPLAALPESGGPLCFAVELRESDPLATSAMSATDRTSQSPKPPGFCRGVTWVRNLGCKWLRFPP